MATMPKNPNWVKRKDEPRRRPATLPDYAADAATGASRQVRRRAGRVLVAREAAADRVLELAARKATVKRRRGERQAEAQRKAAAVAVEVGVAA